MRVRADALVGMFGSVMISPCRFELTVFHGVAPTYGEVLGLEPSLEPVVQGQGGIHPSEATADDDDVGALARFHTVSYAISYRKEASHYFSGCAKRSINSFPISTFSASSVSISPPFLGLKAGTGAPSNTKRRTIAAGSKQAPSNS